MAGCPRYCAAWWARPSAGSRRPIYRARRTSYELAEDPAPGSRRRTHRSRHALHQSARRARRDARRGDAAARRACTGPSLASRPAAGLHAGHAHQVGVAARRRGAGIPDGAHRRNVRACCASTACWCATRRRRSRTAARISSAASPKPARHPGCAAAPAVPGRSLRIDKQLTAEGAASWMSGPADRRGRRRRTGAVRHCHARAGATSSARRAHRVLRAALARRGRKAVLIDGDAGRARRAEPTCIPGAGAPK